RESSAPRRLDSRDEERRPRRWPSPPPPPSSPTAGTFSSLSIESDISLSDFVVSCRRGQSPPPIRISIPPGGQPLPRRQYGRGRYCHHDRTPHPRYQRLWRARPPERRPTWHLLYSMTSLPCLLALCRACWPPRAFWRWCRR